MALILVFQVASQKSAVFFFTGVYTFSRSIWTKQETRWTQSERLDLPLYFAQKGTNQSANFWDFWMLRSKFMKFVLFFIQTIGFCPNFTWLFSVMGVSNSSGLFSWNFIYLQQKEPIKVQIWWSLTWVVKSLKFWTLMGSFFQNYIKFQIKMYRKVISHDT